MAAERVAQLGADLLGHGVAGASHPPPGGGSPIVLSGSRATTTTRRAGGPPHAITAAPGEVDPGVNGRHGTMVRRGRTRRIGADYGFQLRDARSPRPTGVVGDAGVAGQADEARPRGDRLLQVDVCRRASSQPRRSARTSVLRDGWRSLHSATFSIWRMRSRVR